MLKAACFLLLVAVFGVLGAYVTVEFARDSPEYYPTGFSEEQIEQSAEYLYGLAVTCLDHPITNLFVVKTNLVGFEAVPTSSTTEPQEPEDQRGRALYRPAPSVVDRHKFNAVFQKYSYFSIPVGQIEIFNSETSVC